MAVAIYKTRERNYMAATLIIAHSGAIRGFKPTEYLPQDGQGVLVKITTRRSVSDRERAFVQDMINCFNSEIFQVIYVANPSDLTNSWMPLNGGGGFYTREIEAWAPMPRLAI